MEKIFNMDKSFIKKVIILALPIVIQNFISSSLNIIDTMMIGKLGESEIAAVGIANQYFFMLNILMMGLFSGIGIFISQYFGKKDEKNIKKISRNRSCFCKYSWQRIYNICSIYS